MNETQLKRYHIIGAVFTIIVGTLMHFVYAWSGGDMLVGIFAPVNESVWEHLKMLFWPVLAFNLVEYYVYGHELKNFIPVKVLSIYWGMLTIPVLYYFYTFFTGEHYLILDILIFIISVAVTFSFSYRNLKSQDKYTSEYANLSAIIILFIFIAMFVLFTFVQPKIDLFYDSSKGLYGIPKK